MPWVCIWLSYRSGWECFLLSRLNVTNEVNGSVPEEYLPCVVIDVAILVAADWNDLPCPSPNVHLELACRLAVCSWSADLSGVLTPLRIMSPADAPVEIETFEELQ